MINFLLAHAGELHETSLEESSHETAWYLQLLIFFAALVIFTTIIWLLTKKIDSSLLIVSLVLLISGFALFQIAPIASVASITLGLVSTLLATLFGLGSQPKNTTNAKKRVKKN